MVTEQQNDILSINQVQLLLAEKRTALAIMRTGIAVFALPFVYFQCADCDIEMVRGRRCLAFARTGQPDEHQFDYFLGLSDYPLTP